MTDTLERHEDVTEEPRPKRKRRSRWRGVLLLTLFVTFGLVVSGVLPLQQYLERENQVDAARDRLAVLESENALIAADADALLSDQEIERVAREQYGFVREGEVGYVVIVPDAGEGPQIGGPTPEPVTNPEPSRGFLSRIWSFITGGDVVDDG
jgi:cell division protein FtsB